jgi:hypothetical protein
MEDDPDARQRFEMAFRTGSLRIIENAARKLTTVTLGDALRILVVMAEKHDERYARASARWVARAITERRLDLVEAQTALELVAQLPEQPGALATLRRSYCGP